MSTDLQNDVKLDLGNLDENAIEQGPLYAEWSGRWAEAVFERDKLRERLMVLKAQLDEKIRKESPEKPTENKITQSIMLDEGHQKLSLDLIESQYKVNLYTTAKESMEHRGKMINVLLGLFQANYYAGKTPFKNIIAEKGEEAQTEMLRQSKLVRRT